MVLHILDGVKYGFVKGLSMLCLVALYGQGSRIMPRFIMVLTSKVIREEVDRAYRMMEDYLPVLRTNHWASKYKVFVVRQCSNFDLDSTMEMTMVT